MSFDIKMGEHYVLTIVIAALELHGYKPPVAKAGADGHASAAYKALIADYQRAFAGFSKDVLEEGMVRFKDDWTYAGWPKIAQLRAYMISAQRALTPLPAPKRAALPPPMPEPTAEERARIAEKFAQWKRDMARDFATTEARERQRQSNIARAEKGRAGEMEVSDAVAAD